MTAANRFHFKANVGRQRISSSLLSGTASYSRQTRASMRAVIANYQKFVNHVEDITPEVLLAAMEPTFEKSLEYCPKDTGALRASGYLEIVSFRGKPKVAIGYGKGGVPNYAAAVHENMEWRHKSPTRAKWLQVALAEDAQAIQARVVASLRSVTR